MLWASKDAKLLDGSVGQLVAWHHAANSFFNDALWVQFQGTAQGQGLQATWVARVAVAHFAVMLVGGDVNLVRVDDDDVIATINVRRVGRLALAAQQVSCGDGQATQDPSVASMTYHLRVMSPLFGWKVVTLDSL